MIVGCKLLDLGDIEKIDWVDPEGDGNWKIRVVGTKGAWAYNPVVVMSRDCFEDGGVQLWDVRLECLRREWITKSGKGQWELHPGDKIRVPHMEDAMLWAKEKAYVGYESAVAVILGRRRWVNCEGRRVVEPEWFLPQYKLFSLYGIMNDELMVPRAHVSPHMWRVVNEYATLKFFLDVCDGNVTRQYEGISSNDYAILAQVCEHAIDISRGINKAIKSGAVAKSKGAIDNKIKQMDVMLSDDKFGWPALSDAAVETDFAVAIERSIDEIRASRKVGYKKRVSVPKKFNPFRYPGTIITE